MSKRRRRHGSQPRSKSQSRSRSHLRQRRRRKGGPGALTRGEERKRGGVQGRGQRRGPEESASATSHVNIRLCVRYGGVRPVCMETKALPSWTTGVEPLVERPCLPTPRWTTHPTPYLSFSLSLPLLLGPLLRLPLFHSRSSPPLPPFPERRSVLSSADCSDYA